MDGLMRKLIVCLFFIFLYLPVANAVTLLRDTYTISVVANGKDFFRTSLNITVDGKQYPFYVYDKYGEDFISAYGFGQIAVELIWSEDDTDKKLADKLGIKDFTTYQDLGITLFEMNPYEVDEVYRKLTQDEVVKYVEISLIEIQGVKE